jgi:hypothetical protein
VSTTRRTGWIAVSGHIVGTLDDYSTCYDWDGQTHPTAKAAISAGFRQFGSDDFNVGRVEDEHLVWWGWMDEEHPPEDRAEVAAALYLDVTP